MTIATTMHTDCSRQPAGIDRLAQRLGLALVAWGERSLIPEAVAPFDAVQQQRAEQLMHERALSIATRQIRSF